MESTQLNADLFVNLQEISVGIYLSLMIIALFVDSTSVYFFSRSFRYLTHISFALLYKQHASLHDHYRLRRRHHYHHRLLSIVHRLSPLLQ